jgi:hypothetical protein
LEHREEHAAVPIYDDLDDLENSADHLERCRRDFEATGNPLYAWEAWGVVTLTWRSQLEDSIEIPTWLTEYFDECGSRLLGWRPEPVELGPNQMGHLPEDEPPIRSTSSGGP